MNWRTFYCKVLFMATFAPIVVQKHLLASVAEILSFLYQRVPRFSKDVRKLLKLVKANEDWAAVNNHLMRVVENSKLSEGDFYVMVFHIEHADLADELIWPRALALTETEQPPMAESAPLVVQVA